MAYLAVVVLGFAIPIVLFLVAAAGARAIFRKRERDYPPDLVRINVRGVEVPAILGDALVGGTLCSLVLLLLVDIVLRAPSYWMLLAIGSVLIVMWAAGAWDDRKGDERPRGFKGHLQALGSGALTGGVVKIMAGVVAGLLAAYFLPTRGDSEVAHIAETVALVALSANLINLLDRAPGRASKAGLFVLVPLALLGDLGDWMWAIPLLGALIFCLGPDLQERAMLGDAGANPLGAVLGVGLAASLGEPGRLVAIGILLALNLASEKWSFSKTIEATPPLRWLDGLGRKDQVAPK